MSAAAALKQSAGAAANDELLTVADARERIWQDFYSY